MKKFFLFTLVLCLFLTACGSSPKPVETVPITTEPVAQMTEAPTEEPPETPTEAPILSAEELLQSDDTVTVANLSPKEYWTILLDLGYIELWAYEAKEEYPCYPEDYILHGLTYNNAAFRLDFTAVDTNTKSQYGGFALYGTKANTLANISGVNFNNYENVDAYCRFAIPENTAKQLGGIVPYETETMELSHLVANTLARNEDGTMSGSSELENVFYTGFFYPSTGNLYNFVQRCHVTYDAKDFVGNEYLGEVSYWPNVPNNMLIIDWWDVLGITWANAGAVRGTVADTALVTFFDIYYEEWMYLEDWAASQYNIDGWTWIRFDENNGILRSADGEWCMLELWTEDENGEYRRCTMKDYAEDEYIWMSPKEDIQQYFDKIGKDWSCDP